MLSGIGIWQLLIVLVIVLLLFGTKRLKGLGGDLGSAIKGFKKAISEEKPETSEAEHKRVEGEAAEAPKTTPQAADQTQPQNKS